MKKIIIGIAIALTILVLAVQEAILSQNITIFQSNPVISTLALVALIWLTAFEIEPFIHFVRTFPKSR